MAVRGVRGATTVSADVADLVLHATRDLLVEMGRANPTLHSEDLASAFFTVTPDICSVHPAQAARELGWTGVPLLCAVEINITGSLALCIRVLLHWNTDLRQDQIRAVYLREAVRLRPDLAGNPDR